MKSLLDSAKVTELFESMKAYGSTSEGGAYSNYHKQFMLGCKIDDIRSKVVAVEAKLTTTHYDGDYARNEAKRAPQVAPG